MTRGLPPLLALVLGMGFAAGAPRPPDEVTSYSGICDASAAVALGPRTFVVASDEENVLRVYDRFEGGGPIQTFDLAVFLRSDLRHPESDIEGAARLGDRIYWIGSHGANRNGKVRRGRRVLFATDVTFDGRTVRLTPAGTPYRDLVMDLSESAALASYRLGEAALRPPKDGGGLNIEGLAATPEGTLLIGFRSPSPGGRALLVPLLNPGEAVAGKPARLGGPILLSLGGLGVRDIAYSTARRAYLIVAGPAGPESGFRLYRWSGAPSDEPKRVDGARFDGLQPEAIVIYPGDGREIQVLSDDGTRRVGGVECRNATPDLRSFRSIRVTP
jgi:hypothetical protein